MGGYRFGLLKIRKYITSITSLKLLDFWGFTDFTEEAVTEEAQTKEVVEEVVEETAEETTEETVEAAEEINVDELTVKVREAMEAAPYVVSDYTVIVNNGADHNYKTYYNKVSDTFYYIAWAYERGYFKQKKR